jgi:hypothetical protein
MSRNKKEVVGTKYFLILFAKFGDNVKLLNEILSQFNVIISSNFLKYQKGGELVIVHFETEETFKNLKEFCGLVLDKTVENYILFPNNKNVYLSFPQDFKEYLLDLDNDNIDFEMNIDDIVEFMEDEDEEEDDILSEINKKLGKKNPMEQLLKSLKTLEPTFTLDELLDKVKNNGLKSLTENEKEQLYDYSKRI